VPFRVEVFGTVASPNLPARKGILALRHAHPTTLIGGSRLRFRYGGRDRLVHPESVRSQNEHWYLRGLEDGTDVVKAFVVSRMSAVAIDRPDTAQRVNAEPSLTLHPMRWQVDPPVDVTVRTTSAYRLDVVRWLGKPSSETSEGETVDMTYAVTNRAALRTRLYELGPRVELISPDEVRLEIVDELLTAADESA
jgi:predicted DNA-binding transcriptional regulator YafY